MTNLEESKRLSQRGRVVYTHKAEFTIKATNHARSRHIDWLLPEFALAGSIF